MTADADRIVIPDATLRIDAMPAAGRTLKLVVDLPEREAIARRLRITRVERLEAELTALRLQGGFRVNGRLSARIVQPSVLTLDPVTQDITEPLDRVFLPGGEKLFAEDADAEVFVDVEGEELPDHFEGNEADLSDMIIETLALAIDPYPRADNETLASVGDAPDPDEKPFAALKALKDKLSGDKS
jgi:uncharacterized metal-binding protein YceD (DUF177 family)